MQRAKKKERQDYILILSDHLNSRQNPPSRLLREFQRILPREKIHEQNETRNGDGEKRRTASIPTASEEENSPFDSETRNFQSEPKSSLPERDPILSFSFRKKEKRDQHWREKSSKRRNSNRHVHRRNRQLVDSTHRSPPVCIVLHQSCLRTIDFRDNCDGRS